MPICHYFYFLFAETLNICLFRNSDIGIYILFFFFLERTNENPHFIFVKLILSKSSNCFQVYVTDIFVFKMALLVREMALF